MRIDKALHAIEDANIGKLRDVSGAAARVCPKRRRADARVQGAACRDALVG